MAAQLGVLNTNSRYLHEVGEASGETTFCVHPATFVLVSSFLKF